MTDNTSEARKPPRNTRKRLEELYGPRPEHPLKKQRAAYSVQKRNAKQRGIEWKFTFPEWWAWWQIDNRGANRGMGKDKFVMARKGDQGPYSPENVYCATHSANWRDVPPQVRSDAKRKQHANNPGLKMPIMKRGVDNPNSIPIETPAGRFANAMEAAAHFGITRQGIRYRITAGVAGWRYAEKESAS